MEISTQKTAAVLGLKKIETDLDLALAIEKGFPVNTIDRVVKVVAPEEPSIAFKIVPRPTLARYKQRKGHSLSLEQSDHVARLARIWTAAYAVWKSEGATRRFLFEPHQLLGGKRPIDMARTAVGAKMVEDILGRLEYGTVS